MKTRVERQFHRPALVESAADRVQRHGFCHIASQLAIGRIFWEGGDGPQQRWIVTIHGIAREQEALLIGRPQDARKVSVPCDVFGQLSANAVNRDVRQIRFR